MTQDREDIRRRYKEKKLHQKPPRLDSKERLEADQTIIKAQVQGLSQKLKLLEAFNLD